MIYKNLKINFIKTNCEALGDSVMTVSYEIAKEFLKFYNCSDQIFDLILFCARKNQTEEDFKTKNPDLQVLLYKFMLESDKIYEITVECENEFWIWHDIAHSYKDVHNFNVIINEDNEAERLRETLVLSGEIKNELKEKIKQEYKKRFGKSLEI